MERSERRILTTHVGSFPRSPALRDLLVRPTARLWGRPPRD
jgi:methionine synthase II (cobalamin-independent)